MGMQDELNHKKYTVCWSVAASAYSRNISSLAGPVYDLHVKYSANRLDLWAALPTNMTPSLVFSAATATPSLVFSAATAIPSFALDKPFINTSILAELLWRDGAHLLSVTITAVTVWLYWSDWRAKMTCHIAHADRIITCVYVSPQKRTGWDCIALDHMVKEGGTASCGRCWQLQHSHQCSKNPLFTHASNPLFTIIVKAWNIQREKKFNEMVNRGGAH